MKWREFATTTAILLVFNLRTPTASPSEKGKPRLLSKKEDMCCYGPATGRSAAHCARSGMPSHPPPRGDILCNNNLFELSPTALEHISTSERAAFLARQRRLGQYNLGHKIQNKNRRTECHRHSTNDYNHNPKR